MRKMRSLITVSCMKALELECQPLKRAIALMLMIFTIIIAGRMTVIASARRNKTSAVEHKSEASGSNAAAFCVIQSSRDLWGVLDEVNNSFLCFHVRFDVALGGGERSMSSEHLNVSQRPSDSRDCARCVGDERATS